jgi:hypothetical protein
LAGAVNISVSSNEDPASWGYDILRSNHPIDSVKGFPVCIAKTTYEGKGYRAQMGWIQFITYKRRGDKKYTVIVDRPPQLSDSKCPYANWGSTPTLFDAPSSLLDDHSKAPDMDWRADSFLVASPDGVMTKTVVPLASFSWGYQTDSRHKVDITPPKDTKLATWPNFLKILREQFPDWSLKE